MRRTGTSNCRSDPGSRDRRTASLASVPAAPTDHRRTSREVCRDSRRHAAHAAGRHHGPRPDTVLDRSSTLWLRSAGAMQGSCGCNGSDRLSRRAPVCRRRQSTGTVGSSGASAVPSDSNQGIPATPDLRGSMLRNVLGTAACHGPQCGLGQWHPPARRIPRRIGDEPHGPDADAPWDLVRSA